MSKSRCPTCGADRELIEKILLHMQGINDDDEKEDEVNE
jgi:hypothetical protein